MLTVHGALSQVISVTMLIACILIIASRPIQTGNSQDRKGVYEVILSWRGLF